MWNEKRHEASSVSLKQGGCHESSAIPRQHSPPRHLSCCLNDGVHPISVNTFHFRCFRFVRMGSTSIQHRHPDPFGSLASCSCMRHALTAAMLLWAKAEGIVAGEGRYLKRAESNPFKLSLGSFVEWDEIIDNDNMGTGVTWQMQSLGSCVKWDI